MKIASLFAANAPLGSIGESELLNALPDGAYITDVNRKILFWNDAAERITGWRASEVVGRSCQDSLLVHVDKDGNRLCGHDTCPLHRSIVTHQPSEEPLLVFAKCKSERRLPVEVSVAPITNANGEVIGGICSAPKPFRTSPSPAGSRPITAWNSRCCTSRATWWAATFIKLNNWMNTAMAC